jgi:hypothetical protein
MRKLYFAVVACLVGCGSDDASPTAAATSASTGGGAGAGGTGGGAPCSGDTEEYPPEAVCIERVRGRVVDDAGAGLGEVLTSVCGPVACNPGESASDGSVVVEVGYHILPGEWSALAHVRAIDRAPFYFALPADAQGPEIDVGDLLALAMPASGPAVVTQTDGAGAPAQTVTSNEVTLDVPNGVQLWIGIDDVALGAAGKQFRALRVPDEHSGAFAEAALGLSAIYALYPFEAALRPEGQPGETALARLSFPNPANLPPDSAVEFLAHGSFVYLDWVTPAAFEVVATGAVTSDGLRIEMDPGEGVPYLTWIGIRPAS